MFSINHLVVSMAGLFTLRAAANLSMPKEALHGKDGTSQEGRFPWVILGLGEVLMESPTFCVPYRMLLVKVAAWY